MVKRVKLSGTEDPLFAKCWELYQSAFPPHETRELEYQIETMALGEYNFEAIVEGDELIGIIGWWGLPPFRYIEHLATLPTLRNGGYGKRILKQFISEDQSPVLLEVEHPEAEIERRRIGFYQRLGFVLNHHHFAHPPYRGGEFVELMIMTHPNPISEEQLSAFCKSYFPIIHFKTYKITK